MGKLDGKIAIVTGASRGIGAEIARLFASEGGRVICAARTIREGDHPLEGSLEGTIAQIKEAGGEATAVAVNVSLTEECEKLVQDTRDIYGPPDVLVNNAALTYFIPVKDFPVNRWLRSWLVNFQAPFILSKLVLEDMIPRGVRQHRKHIVGIGGRTGPGALSRRAAGQRQHLLRRGEGRPGAVHPGPGHGDLPARDFGHLRFAVTGGPDAGNRVPQPGHRHGRPPRRTTGIDGQGVVAAGHGTIGQGHRPRDLQPADSQGVRLDRGSQRAGV